MVAKLRLFSRISIPEAGAHQSHKHSHQNLTWTRKRLGDPNTDKMQIPEQGGINVFARPRPEY